MAIDVKGILCPQCGSTSVNMTSETQGICKSCNAKFTVQQRAEIQNVYNEVHVHTDGDSKTEDMAVNEDIILNKLEISPEFTKKEFLRKVWISLALDDAPIEIFNKNFDEISENEHQVLIYSISVDLTYQASVGYDRQEPYIDYENYYEEEPYIAYEKQYNKVTGQYEERPITKYKRIQKQRPVTRYRTVTDWSTASGNLSSQAVATIENLEGQNLDEPLFQNSIVNIKDGSVRPVSEELAEKMHVTDSAYDDARIEQIQIIDKHVRASLPGDHNKDLDWKISNITDLSVALFKTFEYEASICFNGKTYSKHAFPFGSMKIGGDTIKNSASLKTLQNRMKKALEEKTRKRQEAINKNIQKATTGISLLTIALLVLSITISIFIRSTALVTIAFIIGVAFFIFNTVAVKKADVTERKKAEKDIKAETAKVKAQIADYSKNYKKKQRAALDQKLKELGLNPVSADELVIKGGQK